MDDALSEAIDLSTPQLIERFVRSFVEFMIANPGTLPLLDRDQSVAGTSSAAVSGSFRAYMANLIDGLIATRVATATRDERSVVATLLSNIGVSQTFEAIEATGARREAVIVETVYLASAYLAARYPTADDPVWNDATRYIRPARPSHAVHAINSHVVAAYAPEGELQPAARPR